MIVNLLVALGIFGLLGLSALCPLSGWCVFIGSRARRSSALNAERSPTFPLHIEILIPAHNEADRIDVTLASIQKAITFLQSTGGNLTPTLSIHVGADSCTDQTAALARQYAGVRVSEFPDHQSKWKTLKDLCKLSTASWVFFVDAGTHWPENFLSEALSHLRSKPRVVALAATYRPKRAGLLQHALWQVEAFLKKIEAQAGGPVTVHGATIGYDAAKLAAVFNYLGPERWLNDDVAIPFTLRALFPDGRIVYPASHVDDAGVEAQNMDLGRRRRMALGNCQWIRSLWLRCAGLNPVAGILAGRRIFRLVWAYWFIFLAAGIGLAYPRVGLAGAALWIGLNLASGSFRQLSGAAAISLAAPYYLLHGQHTGARWV